MKLIVARLSDELAERYVQYLETLLVDLWSDLVQVEFQIGFTLRADHRLRDMQITAFATSEITEAESYVLVQAIFEEIEAAIDDAIAEFRHATH